MNRTVLKTIAAIIMTAITAPACFAAHPELANLGQIKFTVPKAARYRLDNGLVVYMVKDNTLPIVHATALVHVGSAYATEDKLGIAQMTAALIRDGGTGRYKADEIDKTLEYLGADITANAFTEETQVEMSALKKDTDKVLDIFADILRNPAFEDEKIKIARDESLEIIRRRNDDPAKAAAREVRRMFFGPHHPYGWRTETETINAISKSDLSAFHAAYFKPNNMILAVSGDFASDEEMLAKLNEKFGDWKAGDIARPVIPPPAHATGRQIYLVDKDIAQTTIYVMQNGLERTNPGNYALSIVSELMGGGFQSRLFSEVRTKRGLAYVAQSYSAGLSRFGMITSICGTKAETMSQALGEMLRQFSIVGKEPIPAREMETTKGSIINPFVFKFSTPHKLAVERALEEYYGYKKGFLESYVADVSAVGSEAALQAGRLYDPDNAVIYIIGNSKKFDKPLTEFGPVTELKED